MKQFILLFIAVLCFADLFSQKQFAASKEITSYNSNSNFIQEIHEAYPVGNSAAANNVRSITVDNNGTVYIANALGVYTKTANENSWTVLPFNEADQGPAYSVLADEKTNSIWIGNWKGLFQLQNNSLKQINGADGPISVLCKAQEGIYTLGPKGVWLYDGKTCIKKEYPVAKSIRAAVSDNKEGLWIATDVGLFHATKNNTTHLFKTNLLISAGLKGLAFHDDGSLWVAGLGGISVIKNDKLIKTINTAQGLSSQYINCIKKSADGTMWVGTKIGAVRFYKDGTHSLRFSRRWLMDDNVNDVAFDQQGNAWVATEQGVSAIKARSINLAQKQNYFYDVLMKRHIREPWTAGQIHLMNPGDTLHWQAEDDDNDGEYTGNYLAMESFRYAATHDADAREKAKKAFHFLKYLQEVTNGDGYFARAIVPVDWASRVHDNNRKYSPQELAEELVSDPRYKPIETRWHLTADGKWLWKGDASSDEWCGHMMGYYFYYELAADEEEKKIIRKHVASLVDHLIAHDFTMIDTDGTHTHWSVWSPTLLNHDADWAADKYQNSMELLSFLKFAYYLTNDEKYQQHYLRLINKEHYLENMRHVPEQNPAWFIYFDVTLQAYLYPILLHCEKDPALLSFYKQHMDAWMQRRKGDQNPQINFLYCYARNKKVELSKSVNFLINTPLDLVDWSIDHTKREDVKIVHEPVMDEWQVKDLPDASIRATVRWDKNPWQATSGSPQTEKEPVFWLYPYWFGRYLNMIQ